MSQNIMLGKSSVQKGKLLENYVVELLHSSDLDARARRTAGSGCGIEKGDINNCLGLNIECKNTKNFAFPNFWRQTIRDADRQHADPVLIWHPPLLPMENCAAIVEIGFLFDLLKARKSNAAKADILDRWSIKNNLEKAVYYLRQVIKDA